jgi:2-polyprenyl-6-methoxyphenol hydroxylase-like FAD-dependent oxidoreductase
MDVWWFRLPRRPDDPPGLAGTFSAGHGTILIDRGSYYQIAYIIPKGTDSKLRSEGIEALRRVLVGMVPWLADRVDALRSFDDVKLLDVQLNRLGRWYCGGLFCIGDAAHAMSPVGGVGINLAVADAVAAARTLAGPLRAGRLSNWQLARVQVRRWIPTAILQAAQRMIHANVVAVAVGANDAARDPGADRPPLRAVRAVAKSPTLRRFIGYMVAIGPLSEHAPQYARRAG